MPTAFLSLLAVSTALVVAMFTLTWWLSLRHNNFSFVDVTWSYSLAVLVPLYAVLADGFIGRRLAMASMAAVWSMRLGTYLLGRVRRHHPHEDVRYIVLREQWQGRLVSAFFWFFQAQALLILLLSVPMLLACLNHAPQLSGIEVVGALIWLVGIVGEAIADAQMSAFKRDAGNAGKVCQAGLWRYSRHPNYFFESVVWLGFWLFACGSPWGWATVYAPALILYSLLRVTGIPLTEACAVKSKGEAYREYQRSTSAFVPWLRKI
jgi:steroid 5-alpha reductase family enzyme